MKKAIALLLVVMYITTMLPISAFAEGLEPEESGAAEEVSAEPEQNAESTEEVTEQPEQNIESAEEVPTEPDQNTEGTEEVSEEASTEKVEASAAAVNETPLSSASNVVASGYCGGEGDGTNLEWVLTEDGALTISGTGAMQNYSSSTECSWDTQKNSIKTVIIEDGVTSIGEKAFFNCTSLTEIVIPNSITSIGSSAFYRCTGLTEIAIPDSVTTIIGWAFYGCKGLSEIVIPNSVTSIGGHAFYGCTGLTKVVIPDSVTIIGSYTFYGCTGLTEIVIPDSVTRIGNWAFMDCTSLTEIVMPDSVTSIGGQAFYGCSNLKEFYFNGDAPTVTPSVDENRSFPADTTLYYIEGKEGWTNPTWNDYKTETFDAVTYDANGGAGAPAPQAKTEGVALTLSSTVPTRSGYTFLGWATSSTATSAEYQPGAIYNISGSSTLYAVWEAATTYAVTFDANGGTGAPASFEAEIMGEVDGNYYSIIDIPTAIPVKAGYTFVGWQGYEDGVPGSACSSGKSIGIWNNTNFVAVWQKNGVLAPKISAVSVTGTPGETVRVEFYIENNNGIKFNGWSIRYDGEWLGHRNYSNNYSSTLSGDGKIYEIIYTINDDAKIGSYKFSISFSNAHNATGEACLLLDIPFTITVVNKIENKTYTVNYDANGGVGSPEPQTKAEDVALTLSSTVPTRSGYTFLGWSHRIATSAEYQPGAIYTINGNMTLYAVWKENPTCTVNFDANGGTGAPASFEAELLFMDSVGDYHYLINVPTDIPLRPGYTFVGWQVYEMDGSPYTACSPSDNLNVCIKNIWGNTNFVAVWQKNDVVFPGDINNDGKVNNKDVTRLFQYLSGLDVEVAEMTLDVNGDDRINNKDVTRLFQYLSGLDVEIY